MFFSKEKGFVDPANGQDVTGCVEISNDRYWELMAGQVAGHQIETDESGNPYLADKEPLKWSDVRPQRDALLRKSDWTQLSDAPFSDEQKTVWAAYRQALRDLPQTYPNPADVVWPTLP
jgi:hypothetical protein